MKAKEEGRPLVLVLVLVLVCSNTAASCCCCPIRLKEEDIFSKKSRFYRFKQERKFSIVVKKGTRDVPKEDVVVVVGRV